MSEGGAAARLENTGNKVSAWERKRYRWDQRATLWKASNLDSVRRCGRAGRSKAAGVTLRARKGAAGYHGLQHCGSVWACPVCSGRILMHRALEIGTVLGRAIGEGHPLGFCTFTMRHVAGDDLVKLWGAGQAGWKRAISGRGWVKVEDLVEGWVRVWEVTEGKNGWHVHVHFVLVLAKGSTDADLERVAAPMFERWSKGLQSKGLAAPLRRGQDWHLAKGEEAGKKLGDYLAKSLGMELTHSASGRARGDLKTRPVWSLLDDLTSTGEARALARWHEWEAGSKGKRQVGWSVGLRERFGAELDEISDEAIVQEEQGSAEDDLIWFTLPQWNVFLGERGHAGALRLLEVTEEHGPAGLRAWVFSWGVECTLLNAAAEPWGVGRGGREPPGGGGAADRPDGSRPDLSHLVATVG